MDPDNKLNEISEKLCYHLRTGTLQNICRICFSEETSVMSLEKYVPLFWYEELTSISVDQPNSLPNNFCVQCREHLEKSYNFRRRCIAANVLLQNVTKQIINIKKENTFGNENLDSSSLENNLSNDGKGDIDEKTCKDKIIFEEEYLDDSINDAEELKHFTVPKQLPVARSLKIETVKKVPPKRKYRKPVKTWNNISNQHVFETSKEISKKCSVCKKPFETENDLKIHMSLHVFNRHWVCNVCDKEFKDRPSLRRHILRHMSVKRYSCEFCSKSFCELCELKKHMRTHTGQVVDKKKCSTCKTTFESELGLWSHGPCVRGSVACAECGRSFASRRLLASHARVHVDDKPHQCSLCGKRFRHESTLTTHRRTHTGEKPYVCSFCGKAFIQSTNLTLHMRTHTGEKPYSCQQCLMSFSSGSALKVHIHTHSKDKTFKCDVCGKKLARGSVSAHRRMHAAGDVDINVRDVTTPVGGAVRRRTRHECRVCGRGCVTAAVLRDHTLLHTGEKPFECKLCSVKYPTKSRLDRHNRIKHGIKATSKTRTYQKTIKSNAQTAEEDVKFLGKVQLYDNEIQDNELRFEISHAPLEVSRELVLKADGETKAELILEDETYQNSDICLPGDVEYIDDNINVRTVKDNDNAIPESLVEGGSVKLLQVDQSLLQIHTVSGQMTISKITSKVTTSYQ